MCQHLVPLPLLNCYQWYCSAEVSVRSPRKSFIFILFCRSKYPKNMLSGFQNRSTEAVCYRWRGWLKRWITEIWRRTWRWRRSIYGGTVALTWLWPRLSAPTSLLSSTTRTLLTRCLPCLIPMETAASRMMMSRPAYGKCTGATQSA